MTRPDECTSGTAVSTVSPPSCLLSSSPMIGRLKNSAVAGAPTPMSRARASARGRGRTRRALRTPRARRGASASRSLLSMAKADDTTAKRHQRRTSRVEVSRTHVQPVSLQTC